MKKILIITRNPIVNTRQMENTGGVSRDGKYQFVINDWDCKPDFVVVNGKAVRETRMFDVPKSSTILITDEPYSVLAYPKGYYRQFGTVITNQQEIKSINGTNVIHTHTFLPWYVGMTWEPDHSNRITLDYNQIKTANPVKEKLMSVVSSYKTCSAGHVARRRFVNRLMARYGDKVELFGERVNDFRDKWDVTAPYKYQIVIENCCNKDYWTEKIALAGGGESFIYGSLVLIFIVCVVHQDCCQLCYDMRKPMLQWQKEQTRTDSCYPRHTMLALA